MCLRWKKDHKRKLILQDANPVEILVHYSKLPKGTHFAAWEQPQVFTDEVRATFRSLRN